MLPYAYIMNAVLYCDKQYQIEIHDMERPIASFMSMFANSNRDPRKNSKPYTAEDFYWYKVDIAGKLPGSRYGAAAMKMVEEGIFPYWALFVYKDLAAVASKSTAPDPLYLMADDALILGPTFADGNVYGMLIAQHAVSMRTIEMRLPDEQVMRVAMPKIEGAIYVEEDVLMRLSD